MARLRKAIPSSNATPEPIVRKRARKPTGLVATVANESGGDRSRWRVDDVKSTIWQTRGDLRALCQGDQDRFDWWLFISGRREYRALEDLDFSVPKEWFEEPADEALPNVTPTLTRFMALTWHMRADLRAKFDLSTVAGQQGLVWWHFTKGPADLKITSCLTKAHRQFLSAPDERLPEGMNIPITRLMMHVWTDRPDLQKAFPLATPKGRSDYLVWYFTHGLNETQLVDLVDLQQAKSLLTEPANGPSIPPILAILWSHDPDLKARFPMPLDGQLVQWAWSEGVARYPILKRLQDLTTANVSRPAKPPVARGPKAIASHPPGYNLIGYARGQFGIGEDVRMAALALQAAGVPFSIYNIEPGSEVSQNDRSAEAFISDRLPYSTNLLCTTGIETARLAAVYGSGLFDGRKTIGFWPWELPEWSEQWTHAFDLVDEVWASSKYTHDAYMRCSPKPVRHTPMAVTTEATDRRRRRGFGLSAKPFLFVFSFDMLSSLARKNPQACVQAFKLAFPKKTEPVGLVVKAMRASPGNPVWEQLLQDADEDKRISIIDKTLSRGAVLDLYRACDCFVSLHRAEGFGRGIAEAMILGKPAIVTAFSGNMDFTTEETAALVDMSLRKVAPGEYPFAQGQFWAEPDISHAAWWMRKLFEDDSLRKKLAHEGQRRTQAAYAPAAVGQKYAALLDL